MNGLKIYEHINLWNVGEDGAILGCTGDIGFLYRATPTVDVTLLADHEAERWVESVKGLLAALPAGSAASFFADVEEKPSAEAVALASRAGASQHGPIKDLLTAKAASLGAVQRTVSFHLAASVGGKNFLKLPLFSRVLFPQRTIKSELKKQHRELSSELVNLDRVLRAQAAAVGIALERLSPQEIKAFYWKQLNPSKAANITENASGKTTTLRSQLAQSAGREYDGSFWIDGLHHKAVSLLHFGEEAALGSIDRLLSRLPAGSSLRAHVLSLDLESALEAAKSEARRSAGLMFLQGSKNYEAVARGAELDELITLARSKGERLYRISLSVIVRSTDANGCADLSHAALSGLRNCLAADGLVEDLNHRRLFFGSLPLGHTNNPRRHTLTGEACARLLPLSAPWKGTVGGQGMILRCREGEVVGFDPFEGGAPHHGLVIGSTGSGKSFTMNYLVMSLFAADPSTRFAIIDIGGSYRRLCDILGGSYFELKLSERYAINPFPLETQMRDGADFDPDRLGFLSLVLEKMLMERAGQNQKRIIEGALRRLYDGKRRDAPLLNDFIRALTDLEGSSEVEAVDRAEAAEMARSLKFYTDGIYGKILNQPSSLKPFEKRLTVFDLARLKEHRELQSILVFLIGFGLGEQLADKRAKKVVIFDEAWEFFNDPAASELISRLYRTARKHNAAILSVSQSPIDFLKSQASAAMLANSFWKIFLRLDMGHDALKSFGLNEPQIDAVRSLTMRPKEFSEMLLNYGQHSRVVRVEPTPLEYWTATTNAAECAMEDALAKTHQGDRFSLVKAMAQREVIHAV